MSNHAAVELGRLGGLARAKRLDKQTRIDIARLGGIASASKRKLSGKKEACQSEQSSVNVTKESLNFSIDTYR